MKIIIGITLIGMVVLGGCEYAKPDGNLEDWKNEIRDAEKAFNDMAQAEGLTTAFEYFVAHDGVINRGNQIIQGKEAIKQYFENGVKPNETLTWTPTFIDVSRSGDLGYTYGDYIFSYPDSLGAMQSSNGIFHTVWKRQADGQWRFVWD